MSQVSKCSVDIAMSRCSVCMSEVSRCSIDISTVFSGSNDHSTKFWARNKPGDSMKDRYNLNLLPVEDEMDDPHSQLNPSVGSATSSSFSMSSSSTLLPGMGIDEEQLQQIKQGTQSDSLLSNYIITLSLFTLSLLTLTTHSHYSLCLKEYSYR